jgi:hypothetical protein
LNPQLKIPDLGFQKMLGLSIRRKVMSTAGGDFLIEAVMGPNSGSSAQARPSAKGEKNENPAHPFSAP